MALSLYNAFDIPALAWSDHSLSPVLVEPGHQVPEAVTMMTIRSLNHHVLVWSRRTASIIYPTENDILGGRGKHNLYHPGNVWLTHFTEPFKTEYRSASPTRKANIILNEILAPINQQGRRFVKLELHDRLRDIWKWNLEKNARTKIGTKLRDMNKTHTVNYAQSPPRVLPPQMVSLPISIQETDAPLQDSLVLFEDALLREVLVLDNDHTEAEGVNIA